LAAERDIVFVRGLVVHAILGVLPQERTTAQPVRIDLEISLDTHTAATSHELEDTLDYANLAGSVKTLAIEAECLLVETLADKIAALALQQPLVQAVQVSVSKPNALDDADAVGVRIHRSR